MPREGRLALACGPGGTAGRWVGCVPVCVAHACCCAVVRAHNGPAMRPSRPWAGLRGGPCVCPPPTCWGPWGLPLPLPPPPPPGAAGAGEQLGQQGGWLPLHSGGCTRGVWQVGQLRAGRGAGGGGWWASAEWAHTPRMELNGRTCTRAQGAAWDGCAPHHWVMWVQPSCDRSAKRVWTSRRAQRACAWRNSAASCAHSQSMTPQSSRQCLHVLGLAGGAARLREMIRCREAGLARAVPGRASHAPRNLCCADAASAGAGARRTGSDRATCAPVP
jgi:hypothetical protein